MNQELNYIPKSQFEYWQSVFNNINILFNEIQKTFFKTDLEIFHFLFESLQFQIMKREIKVDKLSGDKKTFDFTIDHLKAFHLAHIISHQYSPISPQLTIILHYSTQIRQSYIFLHQLIIILFHGMSHTIFDNNFSNVGNMYWQKSKKIICKFKLNFWISYPITNIHFFWINFFPFSIQIISNSNIPPSHWTMVYFFYVYSCFFFYMKLM